MRSLMQIRWQRIVPFSLALSLCLILTGARAGADVAANPVTVWSRIALSGISGPFSARTTTLMHIAIHDALNWIEPRFATWSGDAPAGESRSDSAPAAIAAAAHAVLVARDPQRRAPIDAALKNALGRVTDGAAKQAGIATGQAAAARALAKYDEMKTVTDAFTVSDEPGKWRPTPPAPIEAEPWVRFEAFSGERTLEIPVTAPPEPGSAEYRFDVPKVRRIGATRSSQRNEDQTAAARFWGQQQPLLNFLDLTLRTVDARFSPDDPWASARAMALVSIALSDSLIVAARAQERFAYWRPISAIREGGFGIEGDPDWTPLLPTPQHPEHPSGYAAQCGAGASISTRLFGNPKKPVRFVATDVRGRPSRRHESYTDIATECAASREWAGLNFSSSNAAGLQLGEAVARMVVETQLQPLRAGASSGSTPKAN